MVAKKKKNTAYTLLGKIGDIMLIPVVLVALVVSLLIFYQGQSDRMPSVFGYSVVRILSGSMVKSGFNIGDNVIIKKTNTDTLWKGDIIAFFPKADPADSGRVLTKLETKEQEPVITKPIPDGRLTLNDLQGKGIRVYFHEIINVFYDQTGTKYFETKGSSNSSPDGVKVRADFVLGKYVNTPMWVRGSVKWLASSVGMVCCVCIPLGILVIFQALALIEQVNFMYVEKKLMKGEMHWQDREARRLIKTGEMEEVCKIVYYMKVDEDERSELEEEIWLFGGKLSKKQKLYRDQVLDSIDILQNEGKRAYLLFWKNHLKWKWDIKQVEEELTYLMYNEDLKKANQ